MCRFARVISVSSQKNIRSVKKEHRRRLLRLPFMLRFLIFLYYVFSFYLFSDYSYPDNAVKGGDLLCDCVGNVAQHLDYGIGVIAL